MTCFSNRFIFKQTLRSDRARGKKKTNDTHVAWLRWRSISTCPLLHRPLPSYLSLLPSLLSVMLKPECRSKDDLRLVRLMGKKRQKHVPQGLDIADILSGHLWPRHHMFLFINVFHLRLVLWGGWGFSLNNMFHSFVFVSWLCAKWLLLWSAKIDYNKLLMWDNLLNTPLHHWNILHPVTHASILVMFHMQFDMDTDSNFEAEN